MQAQLQVLEAKTLEVRVPGSREVPRVALHGVQTIHAWPARMRRGLLFHGHMDHFSKSTL